MHSQENVYWWLPDSVYKNKEQMYLVKSKH